MTVESSRNVIQIEFFHAGRRANSFEELTDEIRDRLETGSPLKTVLRFYETPGSKLAEYARSFSRLTREREKLLEAYREGGSSGKAAILKRLDTLSPCLQEWERRCMTAALEEFYLTLLIAETLAVEGPGHSFRIAARDELHDLVEAGKHSVGTWVFIFEPEELLADSLNLIASLIP